MRLMGKSPILQDDKCAAEPAASRALSCNNWTGQKFARYLLDSERECLRHLSEHVAGYRLMHLGITSEQCELDAFGQLHQFYVRPSTQRLAAQHKCYSTSIESNYDQLPLPNAVVDVAILQHALEYSASPQGVLSEAARVLAPGGHLLLSVTNPMGPIGIAKLPMKMFSKRPEYQFYGLRKGRIKDWLALLNFQIIAMVDGAYSLPFEGLSSFKEDALWERTCRKINWPLGNFYLIHAVKREAGGIFNRGRTWKTAPSRGYISPSKKIKHKQ